jgi:hypothetical protein
MSTSLGTCEQSRQRPRIHHWIVCRLNNPSILLLAVWVLATSSTRLLLSGAVTPAEAAGWTPLEVVFPGDGVTPNISGGGVAFRRVTDWNAFPLVNDFLLPEATSLQTGDYHFLVRAVDERGRKGKPETIAVNVNYTPFFQWVRYEDQEGVEVPLWRPDGDPVTIVLTEEPGGGYADLRVRYFAVDEHYPFPNTDPLDPNAVVETEFGTIRDYMSRINGARDGYEDPPEDGDGNPLPGEKLLPVSVHGERGFVRNGMNELELRARDLSGRVARFFVAFEVQLQ